MGLIWPFRTRSDGQWRRIDEGQDMVGAGPGEEDVLAVADGTVSYAHDPGTDGGHFGATYPVLTFDTPVASNGRWYHACYLGHTHPVVPEGKRVRQGDHCATTSSPGGGGAPNHWLEIGFWDHGPVASGTGWSQAGQDMHDLLKKAPLFGAEDGENGMAFSPEAEKQLDDNNAKWTYEDQGFLKQAMAEMEARLVAHIDKVCGKSS